MVKKELILRLFDGASMQRWNDKIRPVELTELDKQAHKMVIAYILGKVEGETRRVNWQEIIEGGIFEYLQRLVLTDLKPPIFYRIKKDRDKYRKLNEKVYQELEPAIAPLGEAFCERFKNYFPDYNNSLSRKIVKAAHFYATKWEFDIIERANPNGFEIQKIKEDLNKELEKYYGLAGIVELTLFSGFQKFIDLAGLLRFQVRWSHSYRIPRTSVLGHMLLVAILSYLFSIEQNFCEKRCFNNYFTGLFHDLPEALTKDISSPVKRAGLEELIKTYEEEQMNKEVYPNLPNDWRPEIEMFTKEEFKNYVSIDGILQEKTFTEITSSFNQNKFNPRDGELVKAADALTAFVEAFLAIENGISNKKLAQAKNDYRVEYGDKTMGGIDLRPIYQEFD